MRTQNSIKNISIAICSQLIITLLGFISRKVFLDNLGANYLGINGLFDNVLSMISLIEGGIGASIIFNLYKPLAENDRPKIIALIHIFKKAYAVIAILLLVLSLCLYPFLGFLMKGTQNISFLNLMYFIFVIKNLPYYFNAHKVALINADQKGYILARINFVFQLLTTVLKIIILVTTKNYILFLLLELMIFVIQYSLNGFIVNKQYSYIKTKARFQIDEKEKKIIIQNVKAIFLYNVGTYCIFGTDNLLISSFIGVVAVGLYSNYSMIMGQLASLLSSVVNGIGASVGNLIAVESKDKSYLVFNVIYFLNFCTYSISLIFLYNILEEFITWWLGTDYLLSSATFLILLFNFYLSGLRSSIATFKTKAGIFIQDKYMPLVEAFINLGAAFILAHYLGITGIFLGTTISTLSIGFWNVPRLVYKYLFKVPLSAYFKKYVYYFLITLFTCFFTTFICKGVRVDNELVNLSLKGVICILIPSFFYIISFYRTEEFQYLKNAALNYLKLRSNTIASKSYES